MRARGLPLFLVLAATLTLFGRGVAACVDLDSLKDGIREDGGPADTTAPPPVVPDSCQHVRPVGPPGASANDPTELPPFVVGVRSVVLDPVRAPGLDLDGVCTCNKGPGLKLDGGSSCVLPSTAPTTPEGTKALPCDLDSGGIDNGLAALAAVVQAVSMGSRVDEIAERVIVEGRRTLLLQIAGYNGQADDNEVVVAILLATGLPAPGCDASVPGPAGFYEPGWCGSDRWLVSSESVTGSGLTLVQKGYVHDHRLVVTFVNNIKLPFSPTASLILRQATVTATLVPLAEDLTPLEAGAPPANPRFWRLDGMLAGRSGTSDILTTLGNVVVGGTDPLCKQPTWDNVVGDVCGNADLSASSTDDGTLPCDALSIGVGFTADPVLRGDVDDGGVEAGPCSPGAPGAPEYKCNP